MATMTAQLEAESRFEDVLAYLPVSITRDYRRRETIYGADKISTDLYLVLTGKVGISHVTDDGGEVLLEVVQPDELFGEVALIKGAGCVQRAVALEDVSVMTWDAAGVEALITRRPRLAVALLQVLARRNADFASRIESFSYDNIERRLARSLIRFSERMGSPEEDGSVRMMAITHELLSQYVGTSREAVTQCMNRFRRQGYVNYSRDGILLYRDALKGLLNENS